MKFDLFATKLFDTANLYFSQPCRTKIYHYALRPKSIKKDYNVSNDCIHLYKPVEPVSKWSHSGSNFNSIVLKCIGILNKEGKKEKARDVMRLTMRQIKLIQVH